MVRKNSSSDIEVDEAHTELPEFVVQIQELTTDGPPKDGVVNERCFSMDSGKIIFAILLAELPDSFLVGLASSLGVVNGEVEGRLISNNPVMRLMKSSIGFVVKLEPDHKFHYYKHISTHAEKMPEFFSRSRVEVIKTFLKTHSPEPIPAKVSKKQEENIRQIVRELGQSDEDDRTFFVATPTKGMLKH